LPTEILDLPRAAIFLRGGSISDSDGIRPGLAGDSLIQYEKMFVQQALFDERKALLKSGKLRRPRGAPDPTILFVGTPRGSFGLEFVACSTQNEQQLKIHAQSLENVAKAIVSVAESSDETLDKAIEGIPSGVIHPLKMFFKTLAQHNAELRLAIRGKPAKSLQVEKIKKAATYLEREVLEEMMKLQGTFRGVTLDTGNFDFTTDDGESISGTVADSLSDDDLIRLLKLTNKECVADIQKTTIRTVSGTETHNYVLIDVEASDQT
jgi:hypothetical protein